MLFRRTRQMRCRTAIRGRDVLDVIPHVDRRHRPSVTLQLSNGDDLLLPLLEVGWLRGWLRSDDLPLTPLDRGRLRGQLRSAAICAGELAAQVQRDRGWA
jgi:hypothetical protein